jgi:galactofuranosylgalactofuranosylrhamnosyl-N-acetylglucosaminyl-diphospho-decaprenol beta-1,5/1,6-galactofuranosyltransferase
METLLQEYCPPLPDKPLRLFYLATKESDESHKVSTNTYFNRFSAGQWAEASFLQEVEVRITTDFDGVLEIRGLSLEDEFLWFRAHFVSGEKITKKFNPQGLKSVWVDFYSEMSIAPESLTIEYHALNSSFQPIPSTIAICTYNKATFVERNVKSLLKTLDTKYISHIFIVNQGDEQLDLESNSILQVLRQPNLGGSGGFARGIYEFLKTDSQGIILMDDDIVFIPEVLYRILRFASLSGNSVAVSTQMLNLYKPNTVWADYEIIDLKALWTASRGRIHFDANLAPEFQNEANMVAWWCGYFPRTFVERAGLPLPIFIHWDDLEYSLRMQVMPNFRVKTIFGFGVWHEPFDSKAQWGWISYFDIRNALIGSSIHGASFYSSYKKVIQTLCVTALSNRYQANAAIRAGIEDFSEGATSLVGNQRARAVTAFGGYSDTISKRSSKGENLENVVMKTHLVALFGHFFQTLFSRSPEIMYTYSSLKFSPARAISKSQATLIYSPYGGIAEYMSWDSAKAKSTYLNSFKIIVSFPFKWFKAKKHWRAHFIELTSGESWQLMWQDNR